MARNGTGNYLLPSGINPVTDGTVIDANWANTTLTDVATAITGSLPRDGQAPMTGTLRLADGTAGAPGIAWNSDGATGFFRPATSTLAITAGGVEQVRWTNGNQLIGSTTDTGEKLQVTGTTKLNGALNGSSTATFIGNVTAPTFIGALNGTASNASALGGNSPSVDGAVSTVVVRSSTGTVTATGAGGFSSGPYVANSRNPIWRFTGVSDTYGISYFQGTAGEGGQDTIGVHFGTATNAASQFKMAANGSFYATTYYGAGTGLTGTAASLTAGAATLATKASTLSQGGGNGTAMTFNYSGQGGQPTWLWGTTDGATTNVYNPSNFNVNYAASAGAVAWTGVSGRPTALSQFTNDSGYITSSGSVQWTNVSGRPTALSQFSNDSGYARSVDTDYTYFRRNLDTWNTSMDGVPRLYFVSNGRTGFRTWADFAWHNQGNGQIATLSSNGDLYCNGNVAAYSDARLKTDIELISNPLEKLKQIRGVTYTRTDGGLKGVRQAGVIAQEVQKVLPEVVDESNEGILAVAYGNLISLAIEAIKELEAKVAKLEAAE